MKSRQRAVVLAVAAIVLVAALAGVWAMTRTGAKQPASQENLIVNGDFSAVTDGMPDGWDVGMWVTSAGASFLEAVTLPDGTTAALVQNAAANDARFEQTVAVEENTVYKLTARVMAEECGEGKTGANLSFIGIYGTSLDLHDTDGQWQTVTLYARTGDGQREATVAVRVGGYGSENTGKAWFTDVTLVPVETVPVGEQVLGIASPAPASEPEQESADPQALSIPLLLCAALAYGLLALWAVRVLMTRRASVSARALQVRLAAVLALAFVIRMALSLFVPGYGVDMGCFGAWADRMASGGPANFYAEGYFCDYPPAYMLVLGIQGLLADLLGIAPGAMGMQILIKTVPIACDIALAAVLFVAARRRLGENAALGLAVLAAMNPALIVTSSCWGQIDSLLCLLLTLMLWQAQAGRWQVAIPLFALAVLTKPQAGLLAPLGVAALAKDLFAREGARGNRVHILAGLAAGIGVTLIIVLPFAWGENLPVWLYSLYQKTLSGYEYATLSTGNLMFLLGGNWVDVTRPLLGSLTYGQVGMALMVLSFAGGIAVYLRGKGRSLLFTSAAMTLQLVFVLGIKMHERYILPALLLLLFAYVETGDVRLLVSGVLASAASAVNIGVVLAYEHLVSPNLWLGYLTGAVQLAAAALTAYTAVRLCLGAPARALRPREESASRPESGADAAESSGPEQRMRQELLQPQDYRLHMRRRDYAIMLSLTALYAVVGFWGLGATKAPQTGYASTAQGESVVIDLGETYENFHIYYYGGISNVGFSVATSADGVTYGEETDAYFVQGQCFKWMAVRTPTYDASGEVSGASGGMLSFSGRYVRVTFESAGSSLWEVAAVDDQGRVIPAVSAQAYGALEGRGDDANALIDEQDTVPEKPTYYNSMYFDEVYHARTGYEHANALYTYETTHPPLGKVFMSWCIRLMGMTPFAWRFAGALTGVLMIPAIYLLAMQLFGKTRWAALCALLLSADCMHFTQTRIATIDSFPVLFMMVMFLFMVRWMKMSFYHHKFWRTLVPLAASGFFMGLAIASKWIGCYGAVGLAVLFFARFAGLWRQARYAAAHREENPAFAAIPGKFARYGVLTLASCVLFFVVVPIVIYVLSYIPYLRAYGEVHWNLRTFQRIWDAQLLMFNYHKNLVATHFFSSPWYEWPLIIKPMWYYQADYPAAGMASSILSFGNPAVWWTGLVGILFVLGYSVYRNALPALGVIPGRNDDYDRAMPVIAVGFLSAYLPWVLVSRLTFIYHYFASVPFIILATAQGLRYLERHNRRLARGLSIALCVVAVLLFIGFYPLASGIEVPRAWCDAMNWFDQWMWY